MTGRTVIFQNPASGTSNHETRSRVRDLLAGDGDTVQEVIVNPGMTLLERASQVVKDGAELVVAAGGDGTVREIASALVGTEATLGIVHLGRLTIWRAASIFRLTRMPHAVLFNAVSPGKLMWGSLMTDTTSLRLPE